MGEKRRNEGVFAEQYKRNDKGFIEFGSDVAARKAMFPDDVFNHPVRANLNLLMAISEHLTKAGDVILDPFGGTGSIFIAAATGRIITAIDIEEGYVDMMQRSVMQLSMGFPGIEDRITILHGDVRKLLPLPCDCIITSPPYANMMVKKHVGGEKDLASHTEKWRSLGDTLPDYCKSANNLANLNPFMYDQSMVPIYKLLYKSLNVGGTMAILMKDRVISGKRRYLSKWVEKVCVQDIGFRLIEWHKRDAPGSLFQKSHKAHGFYVVEDEDILMFRREF